MQITILKDDILTSNYYDADDCAMTRAFRRAGLVDLIEVGGHIQKGNGPLILHRQVSGMSEMARAVIAMYRAIKPEDFGRAEEEKIEPQDMAFEVALEPFL